MTSQVYIYNNEYETKLRAFSTERDLLEDQWKKKVKWRKKEKKKLVRSRGEEGRMRLGRDDGRDKMVEKDEEEGQSQRVVVVMKRRRKWVQFWKEGR